MHSFWQRLNAIFFYTLSVLGFLSFAAAGTTYGHAADPRASLVPGFRSERRAPPWSLIVARRGAFVLFCSQVGLLLACQSLPKSQTPCTIASMI